MPFNAKDFAVSTSVYTDDTLDGGSPGSAVVPAVAVGGAYKLVLDYRPQRTTLGVTLDGVGASLVEYPLVPGSAGVVGINYVSGVLQFHSADIGKDVVATYKDLGSVLDAGSFNQMQVDLEAAVLGSVTLAGMTDVDIDGTQTDGQALVWDDAAGKWVAGTVAGGGSTDAGDLVTGTLDDERLSANVPLLDAVENEFSGNLYQVGSITCDSDIQTSGTFLGDGSTITDLNADELSSGTIPDARFPSTLPAVSGAMLSSLSAAALSSGTIPDARFPAKVMGTVNHGATSGTARPTWAGPITWIGTVDPSNKITGDIWMDVS